MILCWSNEYYAGTKSVKQIASQVLRDRDRIAARIVTFDDGFRPKVLFLQKARRGYAGDPGEGYCSLS